MSNSWAVVTGASSGLGVGFAERLSADGYNVLLVARRQDLLRSVADRIRSTTGVEVEVWPADLTDREERARLAARMAQLDVSHLWLAALLTAAGLALGVVLLVRWVRLKESRLVLVGTICGMVASVLMVLIILVSPLFF